jgi:hypothetical protein
VGVAIIITGSPDSSNFLLNIFWNRIHESKSLETKKKYVCVINVLYFRSIGTPICQGLLVCLYGNNS